MSSQNPADLIPANAFWGVVTNLSNPTNVVRLQAPLSDTYPGQYQNLYPLPNSYWTSTTTWSNSITMFIPTNTVLSQVQYAMAVDNNYWLYVNGTFIATADSNGYAFWSAFQSFPTNTLHYGTNTVDVLIQDLGVVNYFSMVVTTNTCGQ